MLSHKSWAYIWNTNGLQGFLIAKVPILEILQKFKENGTLDEIKVWHKLELEMPISEWFSENKNKSRDE